VFVQRLAAAGAAPSVARMVRRVVDIPGAGGLFTITL
jgi:hypothetical protein